MTRDEGTLAPLSYKAVHQNGGRAKWARSRSLCDGCLARNSTAEKLLIEACFRFSLSLSLSFYAHTVKKESMLTRPSFPRAPVPSVPSRKIRITERDTVVSLPNVAARETRFESRKYVTGLDKYKWKLVGLVNRQNGEGKGEGGRERETTSKISMDGTCESGK